MEVREYIHQNAMYVKEFLSEFIPEAHLFPIEGTTVCWIDWSFLGFSGEALRSFFEEKAFFSVESGDVYGEGCAAMTRMNLSSPRGQICGALERVRDAVMKKNQKN